MVDLLSRLRDMALPLPGSEELQEDGRTIFAVEGAPFLKMDGDQVAGFSVRTASGWESIDLAGDVDWMMIEDRIARSWELTAPAALLEAGGR